MRFIRIKTVYDRSVSIRNYMILLSSTHIKNLDVYFIIDEPEEDEEEIDESKRSNIFDSIILCVINML